MERTGEEWAQACGLKKKGREWVGPCPLCGGKDRFHVREHGTKVLVGCRGCIDGRDQAERHRRYGELTRAVFGSNDTSTDGGGHWFDKDRSRTLKRGRERDSAVSNRDPSHTTTRFNSRPIKPANEEQEEEQERVEVPKRLWNAAQVADGTPARAYLAARLAWPPDGIGPALPQTVRWLPSTKTGGMLHLPHDVAGYLLFAWRSHPAGDVRAVSCEALTHNGERLDKLPDRKRVRLTYGVRKNAAFVVNAGAPKLIIVEGEVDALAARWLYPDHEAWAVGGTAGLKNWNGAPGDYRPVQIVADGDSTGRGAGEIARAAAKTAGHQATINWSPVGEDLANELTVTLDERIAIVESEARVTHREAMRLAWQQLLERT